MQILRDIPTFTKGYLISSICLTGLVFLKLLDPYSISFTFKQTFFELSLYRPITATLFPSRLSLLFPLHLIFAYIALTKFETIVYGRQRYADLIWFTTLSIISLMIAASTVLKLYFYFNSMIVIMLISWAFKSPNDEYIILGLPIKSSYFPLIYPTIMILFGSSYVNYLAGLVIGITLNYLKSPPFIRKNKDFLPTPSFLKNIFRQN
jgi:hypothetical protein